MSETNKKLVELTPPKVIITDDDYASKVDRLVDKISDNAGWCIKSIDYTSNLETAEVK